MYILVFSNLRVLRDKSHPRLQLFKFEEKYILLIILTKQEHYEISHIHGYRTYILEVMFFGMKSNQNKL